MPITAISSSLMLLLFWPEERIVADFKAHLLRFENASFAFEFNIARKLFTNKRYLTGDFIRIFAQLC